MDSFAVAEGKGVKKRKNRKKPSKESEVVIPGLKQLFDEAYSFRRKCFWFIMLLLCLGFCIYQLSCLIIYYLSYPIVVHVLIVRNDSITFPAITFCPLELYKDFSNKLNEALAENCDNFVDSVDSSECLNNILINIWDNNNLSYDRDFQIEAACASSTNKIAEICVDGRSTHSMDHSYIKTLFGKCITLSNKDVMLFKGSDTFISFKEKQNRLQLHEQQSINTTDNIDETLTNESPLSTDNTEKGFLSFSFFLHSSTITPVHDVPLMSENIYASYMTVLRWSSKEFRHLNTYENPCVTEEDFVTCRDKCNERKLEKVLSCRLPILNNTNLPRCQNRLEVENAYSKMLEFYRDMKHSDCKCERKCVDVIYSFSYDVVFQSPDNLTSLELNHPNNIHEIVTEKYAYTLANLLSDFAGSVGFYLGICVLSLIEFIDSIWTKNVFKR